MNAASPREYAEGAALRSELWLVENMSRLPFYHLSQTDGNVVVCTRRDPNDDDWKRSMLVVKTETEIYLTQTK